MFTRHYLAVAVVVCGLAAGLPALLADEGEPTASELYEQGILLYEGGELEAARDVFRRVDPMQLPKDARLNYYDAIKSIDMAIGSASEGHAEASEAAEAQAESDAVESEAVATEPVAAEPVEAEPIEEVKHPTQLLWQADMAMSMATASPW